jgi:hypothetical protein
MDSQALILANDQKKVQSTDDILKNDCDFILALFAMTKICVSNLYHLCVFNACYIFLKLSFEHKINGTQFMQFLGICVATFIVGAIFVLVHISSRLKDNHSIKNADADARAVMDTDRAKMLQILG